MPKERPILFSTPMVRAIVEGRKTVTRRVAKLPHGSEVWAERARKPEQICPYGVPGDRLWVRETWALLTGNGHRYVYRADGDDPRTGWEDVPAERRPRMVWRPSIHMPRAVSRITLEVVSVRVERLHDITEEDARAEGIMTGVPLNATINGEPGTVWVFDPVKAFQMLWDEINGKRAPWLTNPWVWRVDFRVEGSTSR